MFCDNDLNCKCKNCYDDNTLNKALDSFFSGKDTDPSKLPYKMVRLPSPVRPKRVKPVYRNAPSFQQRKAIPTHA